MTICKMVRKKIREEVGDVSNTQTLVISFSCPVVGSNRPQVLQSNQQKDYQHQTKATVTTNMNEKSQAQLHHFLFFTALALPIVFTLHQHPSTSSSISMAT
jgi:hypothetical protein